jgi:excinuclease ABC subunit C
MLFDVKKLDSFPQKPGVYVMKDENGHVLYVGKAKNLRQRVKQYFGSSSDGREMIPYLITKVATIEFIIVSTEKEALLLENTLIKQNQPKYNAFLKDDKTYIALKVTKHKWPMVQLVRYRGKPKADGTYFGPYTSAFSARQTLDLIQKIFPLRQCSDQELIRRTRPCILYDMKRCIAPCVNKCTEEEYSTLVRETIQFLRGQDQDVLKTLYLQMERAAEQLDFEKAQGLLETIKSIERTIETQHVDKPLGEDTDVLAIFREGYEVVLSQMIYRTGKLVGVRNYSFSNIAEDDSELLESFIMQQYPSKSEIPHEILIPIALEYAKELAEIISTNQKRTPDILTPQRGSKRIMQKMAYENAKEYFTQSKNKQSITEKTLLEMQEHLKLQHYPEHIECIDNSNLSGSEAVSALIAFTLGEKNKSRYRKYKIKTAMAYDDYAAMREVLFRRYSKAKEESNLPDLVIIDGGKGHLNAAYDVFRELNIITVDLISLVKEEGRHDKGMTAERVFITTQETPITFKSNSPVLFMLQKIRDEAHRFAITFQRHRRNKQSMSSVLDTITGIGPVKRKTLLKHFGSVRALRDATIDQLREVKGISEANAKSIWDSLRKII